MVKRIRKVSKKGPKAHYAVPLLMPMTALFGSRCEGKPFWYPFEDPSSLRAVLSRHTENPLLLADRILPIGEYLGWSLRSAPGKIAGMFTRSGIIPMGPAPPEEEPGSDPRLGIVVMVALVKGDQLQEFVNTTGAEFSEIDRVAFENLLGPSVSLIPGLDQLLYTPPILARSLDRGIDHVNDLARHAFERASVAYPGAFNRCGVQVLSSIPSHEPISL